MEIDICEHLGLLYPSEAENTALDMFIEAIPDDVYDPCPCGCGIKWKYAKANAEEHERRFIANVLKSVTVNAVCDSCEAVMINGVYCHEHGCPNARKERND